MYSPRSVYPVMKAAKPSSNVKSKPRKSSKRTQKRNGTNLIRRVGMDDPAAMAPVAIASEQLFDIHTQNRKSFRISGRELIATINGTVNIFTRSFPINPGLAVPFPWLSTEATKWEQYTFHYLRFRFVTRSATSSVGSVILSPDYNNRDAPPSTESQATNTQDAVEGPVWRDLTCVCDRKAMFPMGPRKYIRSGNVVGDINNYDVCAMSIVTLEEADGSAIGKLWVDYDVEFFVPQNSVGDQAIPSLTNVYYNTVGVIFATGVSANMTFNSVIYDVLSLGSFASGTLTAATAGYYQVDFSGIVTDTVAEILTLSIQHFKNGTIFSPQARWQSTQALVANQQVSFRTTSYVQLAAGDLFTLPTLITGAAGVLTVTNSQVSIRAI